MYIASREEKLLLLSIVSYSVQTQPSKLYLENNAGSGGQKHLLKNK